MAWTSKWKKFSLMGQVVDQLFLPMKVPLRSSLNESLPPVYRFSWDYVFHRHNNIGLVIDLTNTQKYYSPETLTTARIEYAKIFVEGHGSIPNKSQLQQFCDVVDAFLAKDSSRGRVVVVHCTHGLNRTGYMICKYLILRRGIDPDRAIQMFESARGEQIERPAYVTDIRSTALRPNGSNRRWDQSRGQSNPGHGTTDRSHCRPLDRSIPSSRSRPFGSPYDRPSADSKNWRTDRRSHPSPRDQLNQSRERPRPPSGSPVPRTDPTRKDTKAPAPHRVRRNYCDNRDSTRRTGN